MIRTMNFTPTMTTMKKINKSEAVLAALKKLKEMSKEELDEKLSKRELGPVGYFLIHTGAIKSILKSEEEFQDDEKTI